MSNLTYNRIKEVLARKRKQQIELATFLKKDPKLISKWCNNYIQPKYSNLFKIAEFLNVEAGELLTLKADLMKVETRKKKAAPKKITKSKK